MATLVVATLAVTGCHGGKPTQAGASPTPGPVTTTGQSPSPSPSPPPSSATPTKKPTALDALLAKLPHFGHPPAPVPIHIPAGPSARIFFRLPVHAPVAFLTIDDGVTQLPSDLVLMRAAHIPFTMFLIAPVAARNPPFFKQLEADGGKIEDHTITHSSLRGRSYAFQKQEVCGARTILMHTFGRAPVLFRPPYGNYDNNTLKVVHDCGLRAAFYWSETVRNGKVFYQTSVHKIRAGDILLMHFRSTFSADLLAALTAIHKAGLTPALLEDYIAPANAVLG